MIPFNKPYITGNELSYIQDSIAKKHLSGNGYYTQECHKFFENLLNGSKVLLTTSCTDALEMAAILLDIQPGDEVIIPSFTFVSTANAFLLRGAKIIFCDSGDENPNIDATKLDSLITEKTKAIIVVHYAGVACDMDAIMKISSKYNIFVVEDAAQAINSFYKDRPLGTLGHIGTYSFHETKNIHCGEGGLLILNEESFVKRAEIIWEKGTNRSEFFRGEVNKYGWVDIGSSFLPSEMSAAFLLAQLENLQVVQNFRSHVWERYNSLLARLVNEGKITLPSIPRYASNNAHIFYILVEDKVRNALINYLKENGVHAVFHYLPLHQSEFYLKSNPDVVLENACRYSDTIIRLPLYCELSDQQIEYIVSVITNFFEK